MTLNLYRKIILDIDLVNVATLEVRTEQPGATQALRQAYTLNPLGAGLGRSPIKVLLPGTTRGRHIKLKLSSTGIVRLYGAKVYFRPVGENQAASWRWATVPVEITPDLFSPVRLPIEPTPDFFADAKLPIEPTPDFFAAANLPIEPTPDFFRGVRVPMHASPDLWNWIDLPMDEGTPRE